MGLHFKILDGNTPRSGKSLCLSCGNMARRIGQNLEDQIYCHSYKFENSLGEGNQVPFKVASARSITRLTSRA